MFIEKEKTHLIGKEAEMTKSPGKKHERQRMKPRRINEQELSLKFREGPKKANSTFKHCRG